MSLDENKALVRRFFAAISADGDLADLVEITTADYRHRFEDGKDLAWVTEVVRGWQAGMPDVRWTVENLIAEDDRVWAHWTLTGTHTGELFGVPPTGRQIRGDGGHNHFRLAEGKIAEDTPLWAAVDESIRHQVRAVPAQP
jgi:predicted ester cyclase